jgi:hypothetical protein
MRALAAKGEPASRREVSTCRWLDRTICSSVVVGDDAAALVLAAGAILANGDP